MGRGIRANRHATGPMSRASQRWRREMNGGAYVRCPQSVVRCQCSGLGTMHQLAMRIAVENAGQQLTRARSAVAFVVPMAIPRNERFVVRPGAKRCVVVECFGERG